MVEAFDRPYLSRDNGMHSGTAVADHEDKLGIWEEIENVRAHLQSEGILVAQPWRWFRVSRYYLQAERGYRAVHYLGNIVSRLVYHQFFKRQKKIRCVP